jgi:hypothetical protein
MRLGSFLYVHRTANARNRLMPPCSVFFGWLAFSFPTVLFAETPNTSQSPIVPPSPFYQETHFMTPSTAGGDLMVHRRDSLSAPLLLCCISDSIEDARPPYGGGGELMTADTRRHKM